MEISAENLPKPLAQMYRYWLGKCGTRAMPARTDINPVEMRDFLHHTMLVDVLPQPGQPPRFRIRLAGTHVVGAYGAEITNNYNDEIDLGNQSDMVINACLKTVEEKKPAYIKGAFQRKNEEKYVNFERLGVPLSTDGNTVDMILIAVILQRSNSHTMLDQTK